MPAVCDHSAITSSRAPVNAHPSTSSPGPKFPIPPGTETMTRMHGALMMPPPEEDHSARPQQSLLDQLPDQR